MPAFTASTGRLYKTTPIRKIEGGFVFRFPMSWATTLFQAGRFLVRLMVEVPARVSFLFRKKVLAFGSSLSREMLIIQFGWARSGQNPAGLPKSLIQPAVNHHRPARSSRR